MCANIKAVPSSARSPGLCEYEARACGPQHTSYLFGGVSRDHEPVLSDWLAHHCILIAVKGNI